MRSGINIDPKQLNIRNCLVYEEKYDCVTKSIYLPRSIKAISYHRLKRAGVDLARFMKIKKHIVYFWLFTFFHEIAHYINQDRYVKPKYNLELQFKLLQMNGSIRHTKQTYIDRLIVNQSKNNNLQERKEMINKLILFKNEIKHMLIKRHTYRKVHAEVRADNFAFDSICKKRPLERLVQIEKSIDMKLRI
jgi:hypothetical protein